MGETQEKLCYLWQYDEQKEDFLSLWDMEDISKMNIPVRGIDNCMTNMIYLHTFTICVVDLIMATVLLVHGDLFKLIGDVICGSRVNVPIGINSIRCICSCWNFLALGIVLDVALITILCNVVFFFANLTFILILTITLKRMTPIVVVEGHRLLPE